MKTVLSLIAAATLATGCSSMWGPVPMESLTTMSTTHLCWRIKSSYPAESRDQAAAELVSRGWTREDIETAGNRKVNVGMARDAALCAWGPPDRINTTTTGGGTSEQFVYRNNVRANYIYIRNGRVSAFQN
jgi:hypothetical protein